MYYTNVLEFSISTTYLVLQYQITSRREYACIDQSGGTANWPRVYGIAKKYAAQG